MPPYIGIPFLVLFSYGVLYFWANRMVYYPFRYPQGLWQLQNEIGAADVWLTAGDGAKLHGWWLPAPDARVATLFLHGNAGNVTHRIDHMRSIASAGSSILVIDYRGYGRSSGRPTESGLYADADAAYQYLLDQGHLPERIIVHGESLGSAVAVNLASRKRCAGVVLEAPFSSARAVAGRVLPLLGPMLIHSFDSRSKIGRMNVPLLVMHGDRDEVIPYDLGRDLFDAANEPKSFWTLQGAGHNDLLDVAGESYRERLVQFYKAVVVSGQAPR
ncbi:MAG: alpha/beta hydrolase [Bryobacteraceae bacterium]